METEVKTNITVQTTIDASIEKVWRCWTSPDDIIHWNSASDDWHSPYAENDLRAGGKFNYRMEAKDGSMGFDFWGFYDLVVNRKQLDATLGDGRKMKVTFSGDNGKTSIVETFEAEGLHSDKQQRLGWQAILDNFKKYVEAK
jgi:uncharacterized protein YndB with AHSA1/START domain